MSQTENGPEVHSETRKQAEDIVAEGCEVRERIRNLMLDAVKTRKLELRELGDITSDVMEAAVKQVEDVLPKQRDSVLGEVVAGIGDAYAVAANATRLAFEEARGRGESFAREDLDRALSDLTAIDSMFRETVMRVASSARGSATRELADLKNHVERTITSISPSIADALRVAASHPVGFARDVAGAGLDASRRSAGYLVQSMARLLDRAGKSISGKSE